MDVVLVIWAYLEESRKHTYCSTSCILLAKSRALWTAVESELSIWWNFISHVSIINLKTLCTGAVLIIYTYRNWDSSISRAFTILSIHYPAVSASYFHNYGIVLSTIVFLWLILYNALKCLNISEFFAYDFNFYHWMVTHRFLHSNTQYFIHCIQVWTHIHTYIFRVASTINPLTQLHRATHIHVVHLKKLIPWRPICSQNENLIKHLRIRFSDWRRVAKQTRIQIQYVCPILFTLICSKSGCRL